MPVELDPSSQLVFKRPFANGCTATLKLRNTEDATFAFKVKTTAPKQYCVRPNCGNVGPKETVDVSVILQPMKADPPADFKCKDKFLVQCVRIAPGEVDLQSTELWAIVDQTRKNEVVEHKLRCVYLEADAPGAGNVGNLIDFNDAAATPGASSVTSPPAFTPGPPAVTALTSPTATHPVYSGGQAPTDMAVETAAGGVSGGKLAATVVGDRGSRVPSAEATSRALPHAGTTDDSAFGGSGATTDRTKLEGRAKSLELRVAQLERDLAAKSKLVETLQQQTTELRRRGGSSAGSTLANTPGADNAKVITRTIVNPGYYAPRTVLIIAIVAFLVGAITF